MSFCVFCFYQMPGIFSMKKSVLGFESFRFFFFFLYVWRSSGLWNFPKTLWTNNLYVYNPTFSPWCSWSLLHLWFECMYNVFFLLFPQIQTSFKAHGLPSLSRARVCNRCVRTSGRKSLASDGRGKSALIPARLRCDLPLYYFTQTYSESRGWGVSSGFRRD